MSTDYENAPLEFEGSGFDILANESNGTECEQREENNSVITPELRSDSRRRALDIGSSSE